MARPRVEVLWEYRDFYADLLRLNPGHRQGIETRDAPERRYRWLVSLDCAAAQKR